MVGRVDRLVVRVDRLVGGVHGVVIRVSWVIVTVARINRVDGVVVDRNISPVRLSAGLLTVGSLVTRWTLALVAFVDVGCSARTSVLARPPLTYWTLLNLDHFVYFFAENHFFAVQSQVTHTACSET